MRFRKSLPLCVLCVLLCGQATALDLKIGSLVPAGSPWDQTLRNMAAEWMRLSGGSLDVRVYSAGVAGDEPDLIRKVRIGQLAGALVTMSGLQGIFNGVKALSFPLFVRSDEELAYLLSKMEPLFESELEKKGFKVVLWSMGGWLYFFSRNPIVTPDDLRRQKLWVWGNPDEIDAWQKSGFRVVPLASTDVTTALQSGMIDAVISSPLIAAANQWFGIAPDMTELKLAPLWGAVVVSAKTWADIPEGLRLKLVRSAQQVATALSPKIARADSEAISVMKSHGLRLVEVGAKAREQWLDAISRGFDMLVGGAYDRQSYETARDLLQEYRASGGSW